MAHSLADLKSLHAKMKGKKKKKRGTNHIALKNHTKLKFFMTIIIYHKIVFTWLSIYYRFISHLEPEFMQALPFLWEPHFHYAKKPNSNKNEKYNFWP